MEVAYKQNTEPPCLKIQLCKPKKTYIDSKLFTILFFCCVIGVITAFTIITKFRYKAPSGWLKKRALREPV